MDSLNSVSVEKTISSRDMHSFAELTNDTNPLHTKKWIYIPDAKELFDESPIPGLMGAGTLELILNEFLSVNFPEQDIFVSKLNAIFPEALYPTRKYRYSVESKPKQENKTALGFVKENGELKFKITYNLTTTPGNAASVNEEYNQWSSTKIKLDSEQFLDYFVLVNPYELTEPVTTLVSSQFISKVKYDNLIRSEAELIDNPNIPLMFDVAATASQAMIRTFGLEEAEKAYYKVNIEFFKELTTLDLENEPELTVFIGNYTYSEQRKLYEIPIICTTGDELLYSAKATLGNISDLAKLKKEKKTQNKTSTE